MSEVNPSIEEDLMIALMWNVSVAIRRYLRMYMPTNIAIALLRSRRGLKWAIPAALGLVPAYLFAAAMASSAVTHGGPGWLNILVLLFAWDACKFAALLPITLLSALRRGTSSVLQTAEPSIGQVALHELAENRLGSHRLASSDHV
jgi:hypothetical protein